MRNISCISCDICGNQFKNIHDLRTHHFICIKDQPFEYSECDKPSSNNDVFKIHLCKHLCLSKYSSKIHPNRNLETDNFPNAKSNSFNPGIGVLKNLEFESSLSADNTQLSKKEEKDTSNENMMDSQIIKSIVIDNDIQIINVKSMHCNEGQEAIGYESFSRSTSDNPSKWENDIEVVKNSRIDSSISGDNLSLTGKAEIRVSNENITDDVMIESKKKDGGIQITNIRSIHPCKVKKSIPDKSSMSSSTSDISRENFNRQSDLNSNCDPEINEDLYTCAECNKQFLSIDNLNQHLVILSKKTDVPNFFDSNSHKDDAVIQLYNKALVSKPQKKHFCDICDKNFISRKDLLIHLVIHLSAKPFKCSDCSKPFVCKDAFQKHLEIHSSKTSQDIKKKRYKCKFCTLAFKFETRLRVHLRIHTNARQFKCTLCDKGFNAKTTLKTHMLTHTGKKDYECSICNKKFAVKGSLARHLRRHAGNKPHQCDVCPYKCTFVGDLKKHYRKHTGELAFQCDICQKRYSRRSTLNAHIASHTGNLSYKCDICQRGFYHKSALTAHSQIHSKEEKNLCDLCDKSFSTKYRLQIHSRTHTGEKPYICTYCNKAFASGSGHDRHLLIHTGKMPYICEICQRAFNQKTSLQRHRVVHTKERPYSCDICQKSFTQKSYLGTHRLTHSKEKQ